MESGGIPFVKMPKVRFAMGEIVFYWVGVHPTQESGMISEAFHNTCRLTVTYPDGTVKHVPRLGPEMVRYRGDGWGAAV